MFEQRSCTGGLWPYTPQTQGDGLFNVPQSSPFVPLEQPVDVKSQEKGEGNQQRNTNMHTINIDTTHATTIDNHSNNENDRHQPVFISPVYAYLETNLPYKLMEFSDHHFPPHLPLYPRHEAVSNYLQSYGREVDDLITFGVQIQHVERLPGKHDGSNVGSQLSEGHSTSTVSTRDQWKLHFKDLSRESPSTAAASTHAQTYDAIVIASGHFAVPYIPNLPGLETWYAAHPTSIQHAKYFRTPDGYKAQRIVVVGSSASGLDISTQLAPVAEKPVYMSQRSESEMAAGFAGISTSRNDGGAVPVRVVGAIVRLDVASRTVWFEDGTVVERVDVLLFCTGYLYSYPFLRGTELDGDGGRGQEQEQGQGEGQVEDFSGQRVRGLYEHFLHKQHPTLSFLGLPQKVVPFPVAEIQAAVVARLLAGRLEIPDHREMEEWESGRTIAISSTKAAGKEGAGGRAAKFHVLLYPNDADYMDRMLQWAKRAEKREGVLENGGVGRLPRGWGPRERWVRENAAKMKRAFMARGERRFEVNSWEELGFVFPDDKRVCN